MLSKKNIFFIIILFLFFTFFPQLKNVKAIYVCNQSCALNPSGCNAPLTCYNVPPQLCRNPDCLTVASCICPSSWIKLKNTSFSSINDLFNPIPVAISPYDFDDDGSRYFIIASSQYDPGLVSAKSIDLNNVPPSVKNWQVAYTKQKGMSPSDFLNYVKSRKDFKTLTNIDEIATENYNNQILVITSDPGGNITINDANKSNFNNRNLVLIINGDLNFSSALFSPTNASIAFLATNLITFSNTTTEAHGIFIAPNINLGTTTDSGIKIIGNLAALTSLTNERKWSSTAKPSIFIVFDQSYYLNLLPYLSTANYEWRQIQ